MAVVIILKLKLSAKGCFLAKRQENNLEMLIPEKR